MNTMNNEEERDPAELIRHEIGFGLLDSKKTIHCVSCNAVFPKEYDDCTRCSIDQSCNPQN